MGTTLRKSQLVASTAFHGTSRVGDHSTPSYPKPYPVFFRAGAFPRDAFAAAFLRVMCDLSAAPMRD